MTRQEIVTLICLTAIHLLAIRLLEEPDGRWKESLQAGITVVLCATAVLWTVRSV